MKKTAIIILGLLLTMTSSVHAQWNDNGSSLTTSDKIGIGTTNPRAPLEVYGALWAGTKKGGAGISDQTRFSGASGLFIGNAGSILDDDNSGLNFGSRTNLRFFVDEISGNSIEAMYIKDNGFVGIGTNNPSRKPNSKRGSQSQRGGCN